MNSTPKFVVDIIKSFWQPEEKILEIGCGPAFLRSEFGSNYIGCDITNEPYTNQLKRDVDIVCSAENLLVDSDSIDIIVIKSAFYLFTNHGSVLRESRRALRRKGRLLIFDYNRRTQKMLQKKEGHNNYPCWTQWNLRNVVKKYGFNDTKILTIQDGKSFESNKFYQILKQEFLGDWAIVSGIKE